MVNDIVYGFISCNDHIRPRISAAHASLFTNTSRETLNVGGVRGTESLRHHSLANRQRMALRLVVSPTTRRTNNEL